MVRVHTWDWECHCQKAACGVQGVMSTVFPTARLRLHLSERCAKEQVRHPQTVPIWKPTSTYRLQALFVVLAQEVVQAEMCTDSYVVCVLCNLFDRCRPIAHVTSTTHSAAGCIEVHIPSDRGR